MYKIVAEEDGCPYYKDEHVDIYFNTINCENEDHEFNRSALLQTSIYYDDILSTAMSMRDI